MLQINMIRQNKDALIEGLQKRNFKEIDLVDKIISLDEEKRRVQQESESIAASINTASKNIGQLMAQGKKEDATLEKKKVTDLKEDTKHISQRLSELETELYNLMVLLPNMPHESVPKGATAEENELIKMSENIPEMDQDALPHWELAEKYNLIDFELGNKITGSGFPVYVNKGARLQRSLISYFLDFNIDAGYMEYYPPHMVNETSAYGTGQLPDKEGQMYYMPADNFYMIPTSEVPLTNIYRDVIIKAEDLPVKMTAYTPCFRREAGSYGKDVRGLNRLHQFDKVELVQIVKADQSYDTLEKMVEHVENLLISLELPYRILKLCGGDMGFTSALTYDFEVYSAAQKKWLEVSSVSNFETFQTNRMKIRYRNENNKPELAHSLNGSSLALPRIMACLLENNQKDDGIHMPKPLWKYMDKIIN